MRATRRGLFKLGVAGGFCGDLCRPDSGGACEEAGLEVGRGQLLVAENPPSPGPSKWCGRWRRHTSTSSPFTFRMRLRRRSGPGRGLSSKNPVFRSSVEGSFICRTTRTTPWNSSSSTPSSAACL